MRPYAPNVRIKWPNDLLVDGAKLAGILLEREGDAVIAGFGVNLANHPDGLDRAAADLAGHVAPAAFLDGFAPVFAAWLSRWRGEGLGPVRAAWLAAAHPVGTPLTSGDVKGRFDGLDEAGALRLRLEDGSLRVVHAGDVFLL